ncbi:MULTISPECIES: lipopolysaccharide biosynthesis protein [unclassified Corallococcus]|uniref:lipopolysaccharide biosynthesis protein n=1 Tax=unclassified Corallococcus TaxID=2685029 RepID=UPI001A902E7B|nr:MULTISPECIES: oligosaccharide flippase family protein [unclassified Corallococcus]MBN9685649.1 oligosaccharide flippase family protein [Corallococcus sp. NCSPR001]WAS82905.1 oligosaccharide flippase family protein [Corallococcus sp. NCRR]
MTSARSPLRMMVDLLSTCARHVTQIAAGLVTVALVVRMLGPESLGAWTVLGTTGFLLGLSDLGLGVVVQRAAARPDDDATRQMLRLTLLVVTVVCPCLGVGAYAFLLHLPSATEALRADVARAALPVLAAGWVGSLSSPFRSFLLIRGAFTALAWARALAAALQVGLTVVLLSSSRSLFGPAMGVLSGAAAELFVLVVASRRVDPKVDLRPGWPADRARVRDAFREGAGALAMNIGVAAAVRADVFILTTAASLSMVGAYQVASRAVEQILSTGKLLSGWLLHRLGNPEHRADALRLGTAAMGALVSSGVIALALDGTALLEAWVGGLAQERVTALAVGLLGVAAIIAASEEAASVTLTVGGATPWDVANPVMLGHALNVAVSVLGVGYAGVWAVAGGTVCGNALIAVLVWRKLGALLQWRFQDVLRALAPTGAAVLVALAAGWGLAPLAARGPLESALSCSLVTLLGTGMALLLWWRGRAAPALSAAAARGCGA